MFLDLFWIIALFIIVIFSVTFTVISYKLFALACLRDRKRTVGDGFEKQIGEHKSLIEAGKNFYKTLSKEDVWIESRDKLKLHAELIRNGDCKKLVICSHGFRSAPQFDFVTTMPYFYNKGFSFLLVDHRAHAKSEGEYITYGVNERYDLKAWVDFAVETLGCDVEILLHGISMGGATVLMASGLDLKENVKGIIADCAFTSPHDIFVRVLDHSFNSKPFPILNIAELFAKRKAKFGFKDASTVEAMAKNTTPILFVHGEDDDFVPIEMSERNFDACRSEKVFVRVKGAKHACSYFAGREECEKAIDTFLAKHFKK